MIFVKNKNKTENKADAEAETETETENKAETKTGTKNSILGFFSGSGLSRQIARLTWLVALITLIVFVFLTIPQQKKLLFNNLSSKANSVGVSLHDVAAGAAINEDYASVVTACQTLLAGDRDIVFLIVMKNNGNALVIKQYEWTVSPNIDSFWKPEKRIYHNAIAVTPLLKQKVFHHAQPFNYSGIEWGWIHVGLSLKDYNKSVVQVYQTTFMLAVLCALLSYLVSLFNAKQVVRPVLRLQEIVKKIAAGDLSVRTDIRRNDELGSLAQSVNVMAEALQDVRDTLELRVQQRTWELENQVEAKEQALTKLAKTQSSLMEASRAAGMAEVATGVLHNVGNVLNSVNVSCAMIMEQLQESRMKNVSKLAKLVTSEKSDLGRFFTQDTRGTKVPEYLSSLAQVLDNEHAMMTREATALSERIEHIKEIVTMQQAYGRVSGVMEKLSPEQLMEDALTLCSGALLRHEITIKRQYDKGPEIMVDKHKVLQIFLNLINNAKHACCEHSYDGDSTPERIVLLKLFFKGKDRVCMQVIDNGIGIKKENLIKVFQHGFTTRKSGHGFGLHSGALAAKELGGSLSAKSDGPGCGAVFTLELPCEPQKGE